MGTNKIAVLFPGQGSQYIGMAEEFIQESQAAKDLIAMAEKVSGLPLGNLCVNGPMEELTLAHNLQPALTATSLICWQAVKDAGIKADFFAGHSLGEYSALCAAGVLTPEDTIKLVAERGRLMGHAGEVNPGGMCAVLGLDIDTVQEVLAQVNRPDKISVGNHNSLQQVVLSGAKEVIEMAAAIAMEKGGKAITLNVSIANHSPLMEGAVPLFEKFMEDIPFQPPQAPVYFNVTGEQEVDPAIIRSIMAAQIKSMVRWLDIINNLVARDVNVFIEVGPKNVLTGLMKRILPRKSGHKCFQVDTPATLAKLVESLS